MKKHLAPLKPEILNIFHHLHAHPERSWQEYKTTAYIKHLLENWGFSVHTFDDSTGLLLEIDQVGTRSVGVRSDMDALWQKVNNQFCANHSCGHDAHMAIVLGTILLLKKMNSWPKGKLKFIFQPAEEKGVGALHLIEKGIVDDLDFLYGIHLRPIEELKLGEASPAILHGAAKFIKGVIQGETAHASKPHLGQNAIEIGATLIHEFQRIHLPPQIPYSVKMTSFHAGTDNANIIPGDATFTLDLRAQTNEIMDLLTEKVDHIIKTVSLLYQANISIVPTASVAAANVHEDAVKYMEQAIIDTLGKQNLKKPIQTPGGEDFHFYTLKRPTLKSTMLGLGCDLVPGLHHPNMHFQHEAIFYGIEILAKTVLNTFQYNSHEGGCTFAH